MRRAAISSTRAVNFYIDLLGAAGRAQADDVALIVHGGVEADRDGAREAARIARREQAGDGLAGERRAVDLDLRPAIAAEAMGGLISLSKRDKVALFAFALMSEDVCQRFSKRL